MMVDGILPSLRGSVDDIVALICIPIRGQGVMHVGIFIETTLAFCFSEISPKMRLRPHGKVDGICGLISWCHTHKEDQNMPINC